MELLCLAVQGACIARIKRKVDFCGFTGTTSLLPRDILSQGPLSHMAVMSAEASQSSLNLKPSEVSRILAHQWGKQTECNATLVWDDAVADT